MGAFGLTERILRLLFATVLTVCPTEWFRGVEAPMKFAQPVEPIVVDDETLRAMLQQAHLPSLLPALAHALGDLSLLKAELSVAPSQIRLPQAGMTQENQATARDIALQALIRYRDGGCLPAPSPTEAQLREIVQFFARSMDIDDYIPMIQEELALDGDDARRPSWRLGDVAPGRNFRVVVIGAGMSGIVAAHRLRQADVPFVVLEKNCDVGGTWHDNTYPACRVDIANHYYSYSFAQRDDWPQYFSPQTELQGYFRECANRFGIAENIRFCTEVVSVVLDEPTSTWAVRTRTRDGIEETLVANAVITAVGQLNQPLIPDISGRSSFSGPAFHSARWDHDVDLAGKRVAVIGTGCSAVQFVPTVAQQAAHLTVFQRTPNWMAANPLYRSDVPEEFQWLLRHVPHYREWYRFFLFWSTAGWAASGGDVDPSWPNRERSVSAANEVLRVLLADGMAAQYEDRPDLLDKVLPNYPPASKRLIVDDGTWAATLKRENVALETDDIDHIDATGIVTADGRRHPVDAIIFATGFQASRFLTPIHVVGRDGVDLHTMWEGDDARAYLGAVVPGFPNFFILYGPNTNLVVSGSIIWFSECTVRYVMSYLETLLTKSAASLDLLHEVHDRYNAMIDDANSRRAWGVTTVNTWYKNSRGRATQNWPFPLLDYWRRTASFDVSEYDAR